MKKLLVIGAGIGQIEIVKKAKALGCHVTVVTAAGDWPAIALADDVWFIDIYDRARIAERAKAAGIEAVISDQNDLMMPTVAYVAEALGLPGNSFAQVMAYCNKNTYRDNCDRLGIPVPAHVRITDAGFDPDSFACPLPWIVKPADSQSSISVQKIEQKCELRPALEAALRASKTHEAILEEFFVGRELVCEGFIDAGRYYGLAFADRRYFDLGELLIPSQTLFPALLGAEVRERILACETAMAAHVGPAFAIVHSEYLYNEDSGEIRPVESALRGGGVFISSHLILMATGIDANELLLQKALGMRVDVASALRQKQDRAAGYVCFYLREGTVQAVQGVEALLRMPFVRMADLSAVEVGRPARRMTYKGARIGPILVSGSNRAELEANIRTVQRTLNITVSDGDALRDGIVWD